MIELSAFEVVMVALAGAAILLAGVVAGTFIAFYAMDKMCENDDAIKEIIKETERD